MTDTPMIAVQVTDTRFLGITHQPDGLGINPDGTATWPFDQFTLALIRDGTLRRTDGSVAPPTPPSVLPGDTLFHARGGLRGDISVADLVAYLRTVLGSTGSADTTPPTITTSAAQTIAENTAFSLQLQASEAVTWTKTGGADAALFALSSAGLLTMPARDFEAPSDANGDNAYLVTVTATDAAGNASSKALTVTVTDVAEGAPAPILGALTLSPLTATAGTPWSATVSGLTAGSTLFLTDRVVEGALTKWLDYGLNAVAGAEKGKTLDFNVGSAVLATALNRALDRAELSKQGKVLLEKAGGPAEVANKLFRMMSLDHTGSDAILQQVLADLRAAGHLGAA